MRRIALSIGVVLLAAACRSDPQDGQGSPSAGATPPQGASSQTLLLNTWWRITMLDTLAIPADTGRRAPHLQITEARGTTTYSSTVGCNGVGGDASIDGDRITFGPGMSTKMWCGDELNDRETRLQTALTGTRLWAITGDTLELRDDTGVRVARFIKGERRA